MRLVRAAALPAAAALLVASLLTCTRMEQEPEVSIRFFPLDAFCEVNVQGIGWVDAETDYLPHVIQCENGGADLQALKAQAVAARSYMYYKMETSGSVADGTGDQVYSCGRTPQPIHHQAVEETAGQVLTYHGVTVCAFYVAGADPSNRSTCVATSGDSDPTGTEHYVTYNEGRSGDGIEQTTLGYVAPTNYRNRGCMSQWGSRCLDEAGYDYMGILRFYYGEDINLETAVGDCISPACEGPDVCNGIDDDCDGEMDEDYEPFECGAGECVATSTCTGGVEECTPLDPPAAADETCDGRDEDCDGEADEDYAPYTCGNGACLRESVCEGGVESCTPGEPSASDDSECNGIDDDCDGEIDEDCDGPPPDPVPDAGTDADADHDAGGDAAPDAGGDLTLPDGGGPVYEVGMEGGCGCTAAPGTAPATPAAAWALFLALALLARRRL